MGPPTDRGMVVQLDAEPPSLMPLLRPDWMTWMIVAHLVTESLVRVDPVRGVLVPELAERWELDETHTRWTFHLRPNVKWHDGARFDADDVLFTFERLLDPSVGAADRPRFEGAKITKKGPLEVEVKLKAPLAAAELDFDRLLILPRHRSPRGDLTRSPDAVAPVGTGPMRFVSWTRGARIDLARAPGHWAGPSPLASLAFLFPSTSAAVLEALDRNDIDVVPRASGDVVARVESDPRLKERYDVVRAGGHSYTAWIHNVTSKKLADPHVRRAIGLATPRESLRCEVESCNVSLATGPLPTGHPAIADRTAPVFDRAAAARELDLAQVIDRDADGRRDFEGAPLVLRLIYPATSRQGARVASVVADELRKLGVTLEIAPLEWAQFLKQLETHEFELAAIEWTIDTEPDLFPLFHSSQVAGSLNYGGYADPDVDAWLVDLRREQSPPRRAELLRNVVDRVRRDEPYTFLFSPLTLAVVRKGAHGVAPSPIGWAPRAWGW